VTLEEYLVEIYGKLAELERRQANMIRHGRVTDVDAKKQLVRIRLNPDDEQETLKSGWVPYSNFGGEYKFHNPPSVGQNMTLMSPGGDPRQSIAMPFTWCNQFSSPSDKQDEHVIKFGDFKMTIKKDNLKIEVGNSSIEMTKDKIVSTSQKVKDVGKSYLGLPSEDAETKQVVIQGDQSSKRVLAPAVETDPEIDEAAPPPPSS
jgi:phage baseplate assembly protein V